MSIMYVRCVSVRAEEPQPRLIIALPQRTPRRQIADFFGAYLSTLTMAPPPAAIRCGTAKAGAANGGSTLRFKIGDPLVVGDLIDPSSGALAHVVHQAVEALFTRTTTG